MYDMYDIAGYNNNNNNNNNITDVEVAVKELVGRRHKDVLKKMQRACLSATLNIDRTFKAATHFFILPLLPFVSCSRTLNI